MWCWVFRQTWGELSLVWIAHLEIWSIPVCDQSRLKRGGERRRSTGVFHQSMFDSGGHINLEA